MTKESELRMGHWVITQICDHCDVERATKLCPVCYQTFCDECMPKHLAGTCEDDSEFDLVARSSGAGYLPPA